MADVLTKFWRLLLSVTEQTHGKIGFICLYNEQKSKMSKIANKPRSTLVFKVLFQFRYFSSRHEHFSSRFLLFLASKQLLLIFF